MQNSDLLNEIEKAHYILLVTNKDLNISSITSSLALSNYFYENKIKHKIFNLSSQLPRKLNFLSKFDKITKDIPKYYDLVIYLDCPDQYINELALLNEVKSISIDSSMGNISELLYSFFKVNKLEISKNTAECLYVGIYSESLGFTSPEITNKVFTIAAELLDCNINISEISDNLSKRESLAKVKTIPKVMNTLELFSEGKLATVYLDGLCLDETGADINECNDIVDIVLSIGIVNVVAYFRVKENTVSILLRSKNSLDLTLIASALNAKGDKNTLNLNISSSNINEVKEEIVKIILNYI